MTTAFCMPLPDGRVISSLERPLIMGIVNVTPDSFSDGGLFAQRDAAIAHALRLAEEGADIIDIGGESTRPDHKPISAEEEKRRVLPVIEALAGKLDQPLSIDTMKAEVARAALAAGAVMINDVWGLQGDPAMAEAAAAAAGLAVMHNREAPDPRADIVATVKSYLEASLGLAARAGVAAERVLIDPGIGFGKTQPQNLILLRRLGELTALGAPLLVGVSRKSVIGYATGETSPQARLPATIAADLLAVQAGASMLRVHDVAAHVQALAMARAIADAT